MGDSVVRMPLLSCDNEDKCKNLVLKTDRLALFMAGSSLCVLLVIAG